MHNGDETFMRRISYEMLAAQDTVPQILDARQELWMVQRYTRAPCCVRVKNMSLGCQVHFCGPVRTRMYRHGVGSNGGRGCCIFGGGHLWKCDIMDGYKLRGIRQST